MNHAPDWWHRLGTMRNDLVHLVAISNVALEHCNLCPPSTECLDKGFCLGFVIPAARDQYEMFGGESIHEPF